MKIHEILGFNPPSIAKDSRTKELILDNRGVGIEYEIENILYDGLDSSPYTIVNSRFYGHDGPPIPSIDNLKLWKIVRDNSLREGVEFITNGVLQGTKIINSIRALDVLYRSYIKDGFGPQSTERTSTHVHVDVRDYTLEELFNLILVYMLFERILFLHVNPSRFKNNYCRPLSDSSFKGSLSYVINKTRKEKIDSTTLRSLFSTSFEKYSAFNVLPAVTQGSVEFRHCEGLEIPSEIIPWLNLIFCIFRTSSKYKISELIDLYNKVGFRGILGIAFEGTYFSSSPFLDNRAIPLALSKGVTDVTEIIYFNELIELSGIKKNKSNKHSLLSAFKDSFLAMEKKLQGIRGLKKSSLTTSNRLEVNTVNSIDWSSLNEVFEERIIPSTDTQVSFDLRPSLRETNEVIEPLSIEIPTIRPQVPIPEPISPVDLDNFAA